MAKQQIPPAVVLCLVAAAACLLPSYVSGAGRTRTGLIVRGRVFCDTCQAGFETPASTYLHGAKVMVECRSRSTGAKTCSFEGITDNTGTYSIPVTDHHEHEICESMLVSSPDRGCASVVKGREAARVFLTRNNGIASDKRFANSLGFQKDIPLPVCAQIMKEYEQYDV